MQEKDYSWYGSTWRKQLVISREEVLYVLKSTFDKFAMYEYINSYNTVVALNT